MPARSAHRPRLPAVVAHKAKMVDLIENTGKQRVWIEISARGSERLKQFLDHRHKKVENAAYVFAIIPYHTESLL